MLGFSIFPFSRSATKFFFEERAGYSKFVVLGRAIRKTLGELTSSKLKVTKLVAGPYLLT